MGHYAAWYRREDYQRIRKIMDDGGKLPHTFDEWEKTAKRQVADAAAQGLIIEPVILDPEDFLAFCKAKKLPYGSAARALYGVERGEAKHMN